MDVVTISCINSSGIEQRAMADVLERNDKRMRVVMQGTNIIILLTKDAPTDRYYKGRAAGLEFTSEG